MFADLPSFSYSPGISGEFHDRGRGLLRSLKQVLSSFQYDCHWWCRRKWFDHRLRFSFEQGRSCRSFDRLLPRWFDLFHRDDCFGRGKCAEERVLLQRVDIPLIYYRWLRGCQTSEVSQVMRMFRRRFPLPKQCSSLSFNLAQFSFRR